MMNPTGRYSTTPEYTIDSLIPPNDVDVDLEELACVQAAQEECRLMDEGNEVAVVDDEELGRSCIDIEGRRASLVFHCSSILPYLVIYVKNVDKFCSFDLEIVDDSKQYRSLSIGNHRSMATLTKNAVSMPLEMGPSWQYIFIDLEDLVRRAFGTNYLTTCQIQLYGHCRIYKMYFADRQYADAELPMHLRLFPS
mmetsp:Transcript_21805/g.28577  ORF Transcript_21805/g.28577 Transcript_21805/m.28577 type:complete len:195 (+) Transcript_21805:51-635(+)